MEKKYWLDRWEMGNIRFNQPAPHRFLIKHFKVLGLQPQEKIFVPLCGKSIDMIWLMQQNQKVIGVEVSPIAIANFLQENNLQTTSLKEDSFQIYQNASCTLYNGDLFNLTSKYLSEIKAIYDRGCLTALPPQTLRSQYVDWLKITPPLNSKLLLIVYEYDVPNVAESPFSTSTEEVNACFASHFTITPLERERVAEVKPHMVEKGIHELYECAYLLEKDN